MDQYASLPGNPNELYMILQSTYPSLDWNGQGFPIRRNAATAWFDLSQVYGTSSEMTAYLRAFQGGQLRTSSSSVGTLLPDNLLGSRFVKNPFIVRRL